VVRKLLEQQSAFAVLRLLQLEPLGATGRRGEHPVVLAVHKTPAAFEASAALNSNKKIIQCQKIDVFFAPLTGRSRRHCGMFLVVRLVKFAHIGGGGSLIIHSAPIIVVLMFQGAGHDQRFIERVRARATSSTAARFTSVAIYSLA